MHRSVLVASVAVILAAGVGASCRRGGSAEKDAADRVGLRATVTTTSAVAPSAVPPRPGTVSPATPATESGPGVVPTTWTDAEEREYARQAAKMPGEPRLVLAGRPEPDTSWRIYVSVDPDDPKNPHTRSETLYPKGGGGGYGPKTPPFDTAGGNIGPDYGMWYGIAPANAKRVVGFMRGGGEIESVPFGRDDRYPKLIFFAIVIQRPTVFEQIEAFDQAGRSLGNYKPLPAQNLWPGS